MGIPLDLVAMFLMGLSTFLISRTIFTDEEQYKASESLEDQDRIKASRNYGIILKVSRPFFVRYISPAIGSMKNKKKIREKYKRPLFNGGLSHVLTPDDFFAFKLFLILGFPIAFLGLRSFLEEDWPLTLVPVISAVGYVYPNIWLSGQIKKRNKEILQGLPFIVDLLALSIEAGLDFVAAMQRVIDKAPPSAITEEFETLIKEIRIGASRAEALRNLSFRIDLAVVSSFCATLIAADSVGASVGPILKTLSGEIRNKRSADIEKEGASATTKMLIPMIFLVVPAVFIVIAAPLVIESMTGS